MSAFWRSLHWLLRLYVVGYALILFLLVFWVPGNDFDTMTSYIARIKFEELGPLRDTATLEIQYLFPKFFDYLHGPLLEWGYFTTLPSFFLLVVTVGLCLLCLGRFSGYFFLAFLMAAPPVLLAATALKNDLAVGCFAMLAWWCIAVRRQSLLYLPLSLLAMCALMGTKWHGFFIVLPLSLLLGVRLAKTHRPTALSVAICLFLLPVYFFVSSASVYIANVMHFGSLMPRPVWLASQPVGLIELPANIWRFVSTTFLDTFDSLFYVIDIHSHWHLWPWLQRVTLGGEQYNYSVLQNAQYSTYGCLLLGVIGCAFVALAKKNQPFSVRGAALACVVYSILVLTFVTYNKGYSRYFIPAFLLGLIPTCRLLAKSRWRLRILWVMAIYAFPVSLHTLLLNQEKLLVPFTFHTPDGNKYDLRPIYGDLADQDKLYFQVWSGYWQIYRVYRKEVRQSDGLVFLNKAKAGDTPFIYPFLRHRSALNTRMINERNGVHWDPSLVDQFKYVMIYRGRLDDPRYEEIYAYYGGDEMTIYRRKPMAPPSSKSD